ncbi:MAG: integrase [Oceanicoccus sp.]|jgi:integrase
MARISKPLSDLQIKQAKPQGQNYTIADGQGLQLLIRTSGTKSWQFKYYKPYSKSRTNIGLGSYPEVTLSEARRIRDDYRSLLAKDIDPKDQRDEHNRQQKLAHGNTLKAITEEWIKVKQSQVSKDHAADIFRSFELHLFPSLGNYPLHKIKAPIAIETLKPIQAKGQLDLVKRLAQRLNEVMNYAVNSGIIEHNPLTGITNAFQAAKKTHFATLKPEELPELMKALREANIAHMTRLLIQWQLHTMVRPGEAAGTQWEEIDFEEKLWKIPAERMKKKKNHTVPLSDLAIELLTELHEKTGNKKHVFHSVRTKTGHLNESTANVALKRMGFRGRLVAHGMRSIASTTLNDQGFDPDVIESALAHVEKNEVRAAYNRAEYIERRKVMMTWWSEHIEQAKTGSFNLNKNQTLSAVKL